MNLEIIRRIAREEAQTVLQEWLDERAREAERQEEAHAAAYEDAMAYKMYGSE